MKYETPSSKSIELLFPIRNHLGHGVIDIQGRQGRAAQIPGSGSRDVNTGVFAGAEARDPGGEFGWGRDVKE